MCEQGVLTSPELLSSSKLHRAIRAIDSLNIIHTKVNFDLLTRLERR